MSAQEQGLLVHGSNHFIVNGPRPPLADARLLVRKWEMPVPGAAPRWPAHLDAWSICRKALRENLRWAVVLQSGHPHSAAVEQLLAELRARGVAIEEGPAPLG
ncbi:MAG: hypothetical protein IT165_32230 [Bryobacterales bacterium]|nr:hypothetical protein [Bryobacterales bacterium]